MLINPQTRWDIFCRVIDNFGDIGVCWRLARQLFVEHGLIVRLWVDDLRAFNHLCPEVDPAQAVQMVAGIEVRCWDTSAAHASPADVVIEAFACRLPEPFEAAMAARIPPPVWINLEYLSAENWVSGCHALPSPHPRLPLTKYFYFPGFDETTGSLLREQDLDDRIQKFSASPEQQRDFWQNLGMEAPVADAQLVSLFAYENDALLPLLECWVQGPKLICAFVPVSRTLPAIEAFAGKPLKAGDIFRRGQLEIRLLPFVDQTSYDRLLWLCEINFVRGEDSFVRAQWAEKPILWHIYPQDDAAHLAKLTAFLERYCAELPETAASAFRNFSFMWNSKKPHPSAFTPESWSRFADALPELRRHASKWANNLKKQEDLCSNLVRFCRSKV